MTVFSDFAKLISQGARALFGAGAILIILGAGNRLFFGGSIMLVIAGVALIGGGCTLLIWDYVVMRIHKAELRKITTDATTECDEFIKKSDEATSKAEAEIYAKEARKLMMDAKAIINAHHGSAFLKEKEIAILSAYLRNLPTKKEASGPHSWMG